MRNYIDYIKNKNETKDKPSGQAIKLNCYLDGNALCIVNSDFENLQESEAHFILLSSEDIEIIKKMEEREGSLQK